ncbi:hypothetical protein MBOU_30900 [Mycobacterium bourgelatii]|uniref:Alpha/beta hydrolase n=1 Tax=Mycobacterium bourgelatii TaxID=1273442 RepID=A0A7I9YQY0_MYCBU|nr:hypothetical protein MBOU_30900 [Mycobacterium bourgelatii]
MPELVHASPPTWQRFRRWIANAQTEEGIQAEFDQLVCESGHAFFEIALPYLDRNKATAVNFAAVTTRVLVIRGECDLFVAPHVAADTAARYQRGTYVEVPRADHLVLSRRGVTRGHGPH